MTWRHWLTRWGWLLIVPVVVAIGLARGMVGNPDAFDRGLGYVALVLCPLGLARMIWDWRRWRLERAGSAPRQA